MGKRETTVHAVYTCSGAHTLVTFECFSCQLYTITITITIGDYHEKHVINSMVSS